MKLTKKYWKTVKKNSLENVDMRIDEMLICPSSMEVKSSSRRKSWFTMRNSMGAISSNILLKKAKFPSPKNFSSGSLKNAVIALALAAPCNTAVNIVPKTKRNTVNMREITPSRNFFLSGRPMLGQNMSSTWGASDPNIPIGLWSCRH
mmetsp:Transcript_38278/g.89027  ORF Transcript_38278/g.89027 Transcript_38278/m.89027 type:complete len:148 (+) Transcript_38278:1316-1759(+)